MKGFRKEKALPWPVAFVPPSVEERYQLIALPNIVVIDRKGIVREVGFGFYPGEAGKLRTLVRKLVAEP